MLVKEIQSIMENEDSELGLPEPAFQSLVSCPVGRTEHSLQFDVEVAAACLH